MTRYDFNYRDQVIDQCLNAFLGQLCPGHLQQVCSLHNPVRLSEISKLLGVTKDICLFQMLLPSTKYMTSC